MDFVYDALIDTLKMIPFLIITFILIELFEHKMGKEFDDKVKNAGKYGPVIGALLGIIPQCGFSVMAVAFYSQGLITTGTLLSIFIATSDEALPVLISSSGAIGKVIPFIGTKVAFAVFWGCVIDMFLRKKVVSLKRIPEQVDDGCCSEECIYKKYDFKDILVHSVKRTMKIASYIYIITLIISGIIEYWGMDVLTGYTYKNSLIQPVLASAIGLIPNCAVSVGLVQLYLYGGITFAGVIAGLSSNAGMGLLVLFKEVKNKMEAVYITFVLFLCGALTGLILYLL